VFYNNAEFTEADWKGIRSIYTSTKRDDPLKIGKFGLGFKSIFHLTGLYTVFFIEERNVSTSYSY